MLKLIITATMFITTLVCQGQVSETRKVEGFSKIEVASGIELSYKETNGNASVKVEATEGNLTDIITEVDGATLKITAKGKMKNAKVMVSAKGIESFKAVSKSRIVFEKKITSENIAIVLESGSYFKGYFKNSKITNVDAGSDTEFNGRIETETFVGNFRNNSKVNISGTAESALITSSRKSYCNAKNFLTGNTEVDSDNAIVMITSKNKINVNATNNASVTYFGSPKKVNLENESIGLKKQKRPLLIAME